MAKQNKVGSVAFLVSIVLAVILGLIGMANGMWLSILVVLGLIVGLVNISGSEASSFLVSGAVLIVASVFGSNVIGAIPAVGNVLDAVMAYLYLQSLLWQSRASILQHATKYTHLFFFFIFFYSLNEKSSSDELVPKQAPKRYLYTNQEDLFLDPFLVKRSHVLYDVPASVF